MEVYVSFFLGTIWEQNRFWVDDRYSVLLAKMLPQERVDQADTFVREYN